MSNLIDGILNLGPLLIYSVVALLVFAEDAIFAGFIIPGETAAVLGGVAASQGHVSLPLMVGLVVTAAIAGDSVGYEVGKRFGPRVLELPAVKKRGAKLDEARELLRDRGGVAVFFGRFVAFFRAVMPALAGLSNMPYRTFLLFNAVGGVVWGSAFVLIGYLAGNSFKQVEARVSRGAAITVAVIAVGALLAWRIHEHRAENADGPPSPS